MKLLATIDLKFNMHVMAGATLLVFLAVSNESNAGVLGTFSLDDVTADAEQVTEESAYPWLLENREEIKPTQHWRLRAVNE